MKKEIANIEKGLSQAFETLLASIPGVEVVSVSRNPAPFERAFDINARVKLPKSGDEVEFWVECRDVPRPSQFPYTTISREFRDNGTVCARVPVLAAPHVSERMAELCWDHGWGWFDLAGNCQLSVPGTLYVERTGRPSLHTPKKPKARLSTAASARVLRTLLVPEHAGRHWTLQELQAACDPAVSLGLVHKVVDHLKNEAWLADSPKRGKLVTDPIGLMKEWSRFYAFERHRQLDYFTLLRPGELAERMHGLEIIEGPQVAAWAVYSAADLQAPATRQSLSWLYVVDDFLEEFAELAQAKPVESGANIRVLVPEDDGVFFHADEGQGDRLICTNPLQTWLDLMKVGGRGEEAGEAIMRQSIAPVWEKGLRHG